MALIQVRVSDKLKEEASKLFEDMGLNLSTAIRLFLHQSVASDGFPFSLSKSERNNAHKLLREMQAHSESIGNDKMTLEEINEEIRLAREERRKRKS